MFGLRSRAARPRVLGALSCTLCGKSQERVRKIIAAPGAMVCSECIGLMMGLFYGSDRPLFDDIVANAARRFGDPAAGPGPQVHAARYSDARGEAAAVLENDGDILSLSVRGVRFSGPDFDALWPAREASQADLAGFTLEAGALADYRLEYAMPLPLEAGGRTRDGELTVRIDLAAAPDSSGRGVALEHRCGAGRAATGRAHRHFEAALDALQARLGGAVPQACAACAHAAYNPAGHGMYGALMCFRSLKLELGAAREAGDVRPLLGRQDRFVQETWSCGDWTPAVEPQAERRRA
jgi:hypothetical protein